MCVDNSLLIIGYNYRKSMLEEMHMSDSGIEDHYDTVTPLSCAAIISSVSKA